MLVKFCEATQPLTVGILRMSKLPTHKQRPVGGRTLDLKLRDRVVQVLARIAEREPQEIADNDSLVDDLGFDSLMFISFIVELEGELGLQIPPQDLQPEVFETVSKVLGYALSRVEGRT